ncbi:helix-turn-helix domain-containing protein [Dactylosporangium sp. NPDC049140]|uniref:TetR/AcrR family transcriptional regulator n=1 Tax=Dactylosporangium sp. NPDC049140 TaxID=3155647 RepID=UPI003403F85C
MSAERTDGRRNRETVLRTAMRVFADDGLEVPLSRIAQRAGVGAGTVHRHFPSKEILVEAVLAEHVRGLVRAAGRWAARAAPGDALLGFLVEAIEQSSGRMSVCAALTADKSWPRAELAAAAQDFGRALDRLLHAARRAGAVPAGVEADDLAALIAGGAALRSAHHSRARGARLVRLLLDGLFTKRGEFRDNEPGRRHETGHCLECGARLHRHTTGRPPSYCGPTCRQRARRRRPVADRAAAD